MKKPKISIIIPAFNEEKNIKKTLFNVVKEFKTNYEYEVVVICDGCTDNTYKKAREIAKKYKQIKVFKYKINRGKGYALTYGINKANGNVVSFFDAGGDFDINHIDRFVKLMEVFDADIVIGSKRHPASKVNYPLKRKLYSKIYQLMIRILFNLNLRDTQTGLKVFKIKVIQKIIPRAVVKKYAFDLELMVIAKKYGFNKIFEAPVIMNYNFNNTGINFTAIKQMITDTLGIYYRLNFLKYYEKPHVIIKKEVRIKE